MKRTETVLGRYEILDEIGQSASAHVYRACDTDLDRLVALKEVRPAPHNFATCVKRFRQEVELLAQLDQPHIVKIYDVHEQQGRLFIAMRLVDGPDLKELIARQGYLPWSTALAITTAVAGGLDCAHQHRILHQNLKPANILIDRQHGPMLSDFCLNKLVDQSSTRLSSSGDIVGPAHYIAPEVWEGHGTSRQSDTYALGCILYEMLTGDKAFKGQTAAQVVKAHFCPLRLPEVWPEGVPVGVADVLETSLAKNRDDRYQTAAEMDRAVRDAFGVSPDENLAHFPLVNGASAPKVEEVDQPTGPLSADGRTVSAGSAAHEATAWSSANGAPTAARDAKKQSVVPILVGAGAVMVVLIVAGLIVAGLVAFFALSSSSPDTEATARAIAQATAEAATATAEQDAAIAAEPAPAVTTAAITTPAATEAVLAPTQTLEAATAVVERIVATEITQATRHAALVGDLLATFQAATAEAQATAPAATAETIASFNPTPMLPTKIPSFATDGDIIFAEYFDSDANGWATGEYEDEFCLAKTTIEEGIYTVSVEAKPDQTIFEERVLPNKEFTDFVLTVQATPGDGAVTYNYGIAFRGDFAGDQEYIFYIANDGSYAVFLYDGEWKTLKERSSSEAIIAGATNELMIIAQGETLTFLVNREKLTTIKDATLANGLVRLVVEIFEEGTSATVEFDDLIIRSVPIFLTEVPTPALLPDGLIFAEYFDSDINGWATGNFEDDFQLSETTIEDGTYMLTVTTKPEQTSSVDKRLPNREFSDFVLSVEATPRDSAEYYSYGLIFRENASGQRYAFEIGNDGLYGVILFEGEWVTLKDWSSTDAVKIGQTNELTVVAEGETLTFLVNDEELTTIEDDTLTEGQVGLTVEVFKEDTSATVAFDNLIVRSAQ